jgi:hypothetical protein
MKSKLKKIFILCLSAYLAGCQQLQPSTTAIDSPADSASTIASSPRCQSFNLGDNLQPQLGPNPLRLNLPVARFNNSLQGRAVVLLPVTDSSIRLFWVRQDSQGNWVIAEKQTVVQIQPGQLDAYPMHRLHYNEQQQKVVLFVTLPALIWQHGITIQPVLEESESRWGKIQVFNTRLGAQGFAHPFQGIEGGLSGNILPKNLAGVMNQIEPGSIYIPRLYSDKVTLVNASLVDRELCPLSGF